MKKQCLESVVRALNEAGVRYLIAGGLAVVAHGYVCFTANVDLILDLRTENVRKDIEDVRRMRAIRGESES